MSAVPGSFSFENMSLTGGGVVRLMRKHGVTIRSLKERHGITMKRVREVRANGVKGFAAAEWIFLTTGQWPDGIK